MREIISVLGKIQGKELGICQCHEHLMLEKGEGYYLNSDLCMNDVEKSVLETERYRRAGGVSLVDAQPVGCCRMERQLCEIAQRTGVTVIASTGFHKRAFYPPDHWIFQKTEKELQAVFEAELFEGMYEDCDTRFSGKQLTARAGIVKIALEGPEEFQAGKARFTAAVCAAVHGEKSLLVHTEPDSPVLEFLDFAKELGMKPERIGICHMDRTKADFELHLEVVKRGTFLEYDTIGRWKYHDNEAETALIERIVESGFANSLLLSLDTTAARMKAYREDAIGMDYILTEFIPFLEKKLDRQTIINMLTENSRYYLEAE